MRKKKVWHYYCEFCGKNGGHAGYMMRHEKGCTKNPARQCGMCRIDPDKVQKPMSELLKIIDEKYEEANLSQKRGLNISIHERLNRESDLIHKALREATGNCPNCMLAAIRQYPKDIFINFNYKEECQSFWASYNEASQY